MENQTIGKIGTAVVLGFILMVYFGIGGLILSFMLVFGLSYLAKKVGKSD